MANDGKSTDYGEERTGTPVRFVAAPVAHLGIRNALRNAFSCEQGTAEAFDRLLARLG